MALGIGVATVLVGAVYSLRTEAGDEATDFWLQEWSRSRSQDRATPASADPQLKITVTPRRTGEGSSQSSGTYCVRTCDGYYFPLSPQKRSSSEAHELCNSLCPAANTEVYERRGGPDASFAEAVSRKGKPYSKMANAFAFRQKAVAACTCNSPEKAALPVANDPTLQPGDIVVTGNGVRVFRGSKKLPYREQDFVDYRNDKNVSKTHRAFLDAVDRRYRTAQAVPAPAKQGEAAPAKKSAAKSARNRQQPRSPIAEQTRWNEAASAFAQGQERNP
jgi:hypothetical protein